jgi:hypothetical protein
MIENKNVVIGGDSYSAAHKRLQIRNYKKFKNIKYKK